MLRAPRVLALIVLLPLVVVPLAAQDTPLANSVTVSPHVATAPSRPPNTGGYAAVFTVDNGTNATDTYQLTCTETGPVTCGTITINGIEVEQVTLTAHQAKQVSVEYSVGSPGVGTVTLTADGVTNDAGAWTIPVAGAPSITLQVPGSGARAVVHNRQPIIRAFLTPSNDLIDTTKTRLVWRGDTVTATVAGAGGLVRHNRRLLEWEVDSTRWLKTGLPGQSGTDSAEIVIKACGEVGGCVTASRWVVLPNDSLPVLGFAGMAQGTLNGGFSAPFGSGLTIVGADVETGFAIPAYFSMGLARSAGLAYSTRQSYPRTFVHLDLDLPYPTTSATSIKLVLIDGMIRLDSLVLASPNTACLTGTVRRCRATLQGEFTSGGTSPTVTRKWLTVEATVVAGGVARMSADSVEAVIVDRRGSMYGNGWWPSAFVKLMPAGSDRILVGPSGTATVYRGSGDSVYLAPPGNYTEVRKVGTLWEFRTRGSRAVTVFDAQGRLLKTVDASGNRDSLAYAGLTDTLKKVYDPVGKELTFAYSSNRLTSITDPGGRQSTVTIDGNNRLTRRWLASPASRPDTVGYAYQAYPGTNTVVLTRRHGPIGDTTRVTYDSTFRRRPVEARLPRVAIAADPDTIPVVRHTAAERQGVGALRSLDSIYVEMRDPRGHYTRSLVNRWSQSRRTWDSLGLLNKADFDPDGLLLFAEGKNGDSSRVFSTYDAARRLVRTYFTRGPGSVLRVDSLVYDANHRVTKRIDPRGQATEFTYDTLDRVIKVRTPNGAAWDSTRTWYRSDGLVDSTKFSGLNGASTRTTYNAVWKNAERLISNTGDTLQYLLYDSHGRATVSLRRERVKLVNMTITYEWRRQETHYDPGNRIDSTLTLISLPTTLPNDYDFDYEDTLRVQRVGYRFDAAGRDTARVNARGEATTYRLDRLGRVVARRPWADSVVVRDSMVYDIAGNLHLQLTRRGTTITHAYDSRNRDTLTTVPGVGDYRRTFGGPRDQLTRLWLVNAVDSIGGVNPEVRYAYDARGRLRADTSYTGPTARGTTYVYDTYERPVSTTDAVGTWQVRYESVRGLPDTLITPLGDMVITTFNSRGQPTLRTVLSSGLKLSTNFTYKWNRGLFQSTTTQTATPANYTAGAFARASADTGMMALSPSWTQQLGSGAPIQSLQDSTDYDAWNRLIRWRPITAGVLGTGESYTFDRTGNISQPTDSAFYDATTDRLTRRVSATGADSLRYDRAGNLTRWREASGAIWEYGYDALERLTSVRRNGVLISRYGYDVLGRRIVKRVYSAASGGTAGYLRFRYRGSNISVECDSQCTANGLRYTWLGTDQLLAITDGTTHYYATTDRLGSVRVLAKRDGTWALTQRFAAYGTRMSRDTSVSYGLGTRLRHGWTAREWDAETGMSYHRARYYLPPIRRWTQEDPIAFQGGANLYGYVSGAPVEARDPNGLEEQWLGPPQGFCTMAGSCVNGFGFVSHARQYMIDGVSTSSAIAGAAEALGGSDLGGGGNGAAGILWQRQMTVLRISKNITVASSNPDNAGIMADNWRLAVSILVTAARHDRVAADMVGTLEWLARGSTQFRFVDQRPSSGGYGEAYPDLTMRINVDAILASNETTVGAVMIHEFGHAQFRARAAVYDWESSNDVALSWENAFRRAVRMPERPDHATYPPTGW